MSSPLRGFQTIKNYQNLKPYLGQIVAIKGTYYFTNFDDAFSFSESTTTFAYVSSRIIDYFQGGEGYHLNTFYKHGAITSTTIANESTLKDYDLSVRKATDEELLLIKKAIASSSAAFSNLFCREAPEEASRILAHI